MAMSSLPSLQLCLLTRSSSLHPRLPPSPIAPLPQPHRLPLRLLNSQHRQKCLEICAVDAAQLFDLELHNSQRFEKYSNKLRIGIIGFGNFGQFLAKTLILQGHTVLAHSRTDYSDVAATLGASFFSDADDFCEEHPEKKNGKMGLNYTPGVRITMSPYRLGTANRRCTLREVLDLPCLPTAFLNSHS